jgi:hypothetical protein
MIDRRRGRTIAGLALAAAVGLLAQAPKPFATPIHVAVASADGHAVPGLTKNDFEVLIDGTPRPVTAVSTAPLQLSVVFIFDLSDSLAVYNNLHDEIERSIAPALEPSDRVRIGSVARKVTFTPWLDASAHQVAAEGRRVLSVGRDQRTGPSPLWDAADAAISSLESERGLRAIVLVSDGRATGNTIGASAMTQHAINAGVVIQAIAENRPILIPQADERAVNVRPAAIMQQMAILTDGLFLPEEIVPSGVDLPKPGPLLTRLINDLRTLYALDVAADEAPGSQHKLIARVKRDGVRVRTRPIVRIAGPA